MSAPKVEELLRLKHFLLGFRGIKLFHVWTSWKVQEWADPGRPSFGRPLILQKINMIGNLLKWISESGSFRCQSGKEGLNIFEKFSYFLYFFNYSIRIKTHFSSSLQHVDITMLRKSRLMMFRIGFPKSC